MHHHHGGFDLTPNSKQIADGQWTHEIIITRHRDVQGVTVERNFSTAATFPSKEERIMPQSNLVSESLMARIPIRMFMIYSHFS